MSREDVGLFLLYVVKQDVAQNVHARHIDRHMTFRARYLFQQMQDELVLFFTVQRRSEIVSPLCCMRGAPVNQRFFHLDMAANEFVQFSHQRSASGASAAGKRIKFDEQLRDTRMFSSKNGQRIHEAPPMQLCKRRFPAQIVD